MSIEKELRQNWDSVVYPEPDVDQQAMPPGYQEGDVLLAQARHPRTGRPMTGPTMSDVTEPAMGLLNMGASALKGVTQGFLGLPGELEALVYGAKELLTRRADEGAFDAFINGLKKETILPTTEEVKKWLDTNVGEVPGGKTFETLGETIAPGGQYKAVKAGAKALKNMPVGMSTEAVGGMQKVLTPPNATAPTSDIGFFSAVEQAALNIKRNSGTGQAMLNDITKGENVKADEIKWIGLDEFLAGKKNVTKQEVQDFIAANKVDVQEVQLGGNFKPFTNPQEAIDYLAKEKGMTPDELVDEYGYTNANDYVNLANDVAQPAEAKFGAYTLPGGENYREILLTLPENFGSKANADGYTPLSAIGDAQYRSSHWDQPNVLAHIRVNDRVDADGKKMLLVEEVQSDWHQAGRDKGYKSAEIEAKRKELRDLSWPYMERNEPIPQELRAQIDALPPIMGGVPDAPMKDTWYQLALKRVLKYAADNGYERVGLTTGNRQAERYDLSKQVDEIAVPMVSEDGSRSVRIDPVQGTSIKMMVDKDGVVTGYGAGSTQFSGKKLNEVIGKEMADKVMSANAETYFSGLDLKVGGEGMKKYYDDIYPNYLQKYGKKWGAKVGETSIEVDRTRDSSGIPSMYPGKEPVRYIDITPEMRKSVGKGQPLFSAAGLATGTGAGTMATSQQEPK